MTVPRVRPRYNVRAIQVRVRRPSYEELLVSQVREEVKCMHTNPLRPTQRNLGAALWPRALAFETAAVENTVHAHHLAKMV